ncbi:MAG TPA: hypothetical protein VIG24_04910 [Acidimicrobiia bacterium]
MTLWVKWKHREGELLQGWETCDECEDGLLYGTPSFTESHPLPVPCPDCANGLVPPAGMVEAAAEAIFTHGPIGSTPDQAREQARAALVAAARREGE